MKKFVFHSGHNYPHNNQKAARNTAGFIIFAPGSFPNNILPGQLNYKLIFL